ncbi:MAG: hypothetical protein RM347_012935 [Nostoc sp. ChiQUE02]|nr:hypothetical protein [Nostoc sp. ChiQUE02]
MAWEPPFGFTSRLQRETRLQRWIHRNALAINRVCTGETRLYSYEKPLFERLRVCTGVKNQNS